MRKVAIGIFAISTLIAAPAFAADMPLKAPPPPPPTFSWSGFYIGGNLGGGWERNTDAATAVIPGFGTASAAATATASGVIGGGQIGYNWQTGNVVFGVEADIDGSGERSTNVLPCTGPACAGVIASETATDKLQDFGTARGRIGLAFDRWMVYATGGYSWQNVNDSYLVTALGANIPLYSTTTTRGGYAVGGGVETALWDNHWIAGVEYLYLDSGTFSTGGASLAPVSPFVPAGSNLATTERIHNSILRARLSYKF